MNFLIPDDMPDKKLTDVTDNKVGKITDNEIVKALECCGRESCFGCLYRGKCHQGNPMITDALDLINRQKSEIERLESANDEKFRQWDMLAEKTKQHYADLYNEAKDILKSEAVKEFARRLKCGVPQETGVIRCSDIDNLLKEMVGENDDR